MRVIITGCRHWKGQEIDRFAGSVVNALMERHGAGLVIVHGAAPGIDSVFAEACNDAGVTHEPHPADWIAYGRGAGPRRNQEMVAAGAGLCLAFHPDLLNSRGTKDCVQQAIRAGIPTWWTNQEWGKPVRQYLSEKVE